MLSLKLIEKYRILIPDHKISNYLLSPTHPVERYKARFFLECGFKIGEWQLLQKFIYSIAKDNEVLESIATEYGTKFVVVGSLIALNRKSYSIKTIWMNSHNNRNAIFVTAYSI